MNLTEFRIGNYLWSKRDDALLIVEELTRKSIITSVMDRAKYPLPDGWKAERIPITEEWLKRCGFKKLTNDLFIYQVNPGFHMMLHNYWKEQDPEEIDNCWYMQTNDEGQNDFTSGIFYIDQLQNILFAITGEEMIIKL